MVRYAPSCDVIAREVGGEEVLLDLESGTYFSLNAVGTAIWQAIEAAPRCVDDLCVVVTDAFDVAAEVARADIAILIGDLVSRGLVEEVP